MPNATVYFTAEIVDCNPTGDACDKCGETPWLHASRIMMLMDGEPTGEEVAYLCQDCVAVIRETAAEIE